MWAADEAKFAAIGSVAGAGPAYVARFIAALTKAGEKRGLSSEIALTIALETVLGTAWMAATTGESMDSIAKRVASPKGTTQAGLAVLDREAVLDQLIALTIEAAAKRGAELAAEAHGPSLAEDVTCTRRGYGDAAAAGQFRRPRRLDMVRWRAGPVARREHSCADPRAALRVIGVRGAARLQWFGVQAARAYRAAAPQRTHSRIRDSVDARTRSTPLATRY